MKLCKHHHYLIPESFHHFKKKPCTYYPSLPVPSSPPAPVNHFCTFLCVWICLFWIFHVNGIMQYVVFYVWLLSPNIIFSRFIHVISTSFFKWLNNNSIVWIYHILFIHSSFYRHLGCFHFLPIMNTVAVNIHVQVIVLTCIFSSLGYIYLGEELLSHIYDNSVFKLLEELPDCFLKQLHFTFPPMIYEGLNFSTSSPTLVFACLYDYSHPSGCEVVAHWDFNLCFSNGYWFWTSFHALIGCLYIFFWRNIYSKLLPIFIYLFIYLIVPGLSWGRQAP